MKGIQSSEALKIQKSKNTLKKDLNNLQSL
jgi:hypothetical protein